MTLTRGGFPIPPPPGASTSLCDLIDEAQRLQRWVINVPLRERLYRRERTKDWCLFAAGAGTMALCSFSAVLQYPPLALLAGAWAMLCFVAGLWPPQPVPPLYVQLTVSIDGRVSDQLVAVLKANDQPRGPGMPPPSVI